MGDRHGFLVSVYGSTARTGNGRDLDLICVEKRSGVIPRYFLEDVALRLRARIERRESSIFAELCALLRMEDGRLIDIQVRLSRCGPQDALDMYEWGIKYAGIEMEGSVIFPGEVVQTQVLCPECGTPMTNRTPSGSAFLMCSCSGESV